MSAPAQPGAPYARWRFGLRIGLGLLFALIGAVHVLDPDTLLPIMPDGVPYPRFVIVATGLCEWLGCIGLMVPSLRRFAGMGLALYAVCVFPANVKQALDHIHVAGLPDSWWYHGPRLACQPLLVWAPLFASGAVDWHWPFRAASARRAGRTGEGEGGSGRVA